MRLEGKAWIKFMINIAMACTVQKRPEFPLDGNKAAAYIRDVVCIALDGQHLSVSVEAIPYPVTTKVPLLLTIDSREPQMFWYYPTQSQERMSDQLTELLCDLQIGCTVLATA